MIVRADIKNFFFDRAKVIRAVSDGTRKVLSKFGAFVRTKAKTSMRKRRAASAPGSPPSVHEGSLKRLIFFGYDDENRSVVIGPIPLEGKAYGVVPPLHEKGGVIVRKGKSFRYPARPYMQPAFESEKEKLPAMWANSVK